MANSSEAIGLRVSWQLPTFRQDLWEILRQKNTWTGPSKVTPDNGEETSGSDICHQRGLLPLSSPLLESEFRFYVRLRQSAPD